MPEKLGFSEKYIRKEALPKEVVSLQENVDLLKDLICISGKLTFTIFKGMFKV